MEVSPHIGNSKKRFTLKGHDEWTFLSEPLLLKIDTLKLKGLKPFYAKFV